MALVEVLCLTCGGQVVAAVDGAAHAAAEQLLAAVHYNAPHHAPHGLMFRVGGDLPDGTSELAVHCRDKQCTSRFPRSLSYRGPLHLVSAMAICFHSMHEGHALELWADGQLLFAPTS